MKSSRLQKNKVRSGRAKGRWAFPEKWESINRVLDKEIETDFDGCVRDSVSPELIRELRRRWDEFFKNYTSPDFELDRSVAQGT